MLAAGTAAGTRPPTPTSRWAGSRVQEEPFCSAPAAFLYAVLGVRLTEDALARFSSVCNRPLSLCPSLLLHSWSWTCPPARS